MRLFIAIKLENSIKNAILQTMKEMKDAGIRGRYALPDNLHITLAFIGETDRLKDIIKAVRTLKVEPFSISLSNVGNFRDLLWVGLSDRGELNLLAESVRSSLDSAGISYDRKKFMPHITIVRESSGFSGQVSAPEGTMTVRGISLMKSEVINGKRIYTSVF